MDPIETLVAALIDEPDDAAAVNALTDELMERYGYTPHGARSRVGRLVNAARNARNVALAVERITGENDSARHARACIYHACALPYSSHWPIDVIPGSHPPLASGTAARCEYLDGTPCPDPRAASAAGIQVHYTPDYRRVTVGARWVLSEA